MEGFDIRHSLNQPIVVYLFEGRLDFLDLRRAFPGNIGFHRKVRCGGLGIAIQLYGQIEEFDLETGHGISGTRRSPHDVVAPGQRVG